MAVMSDAASNGFPYVFSSNQSKRQPLSPSGAEPERDASMKGTPFSLSKAAKGEEVLPVPPVIRIVILALIYRNDEIAVFWGTKCIFDGEEMECSLGRAHMRRRMLVVEGRVLASPKDSIGLDGGKERQS